MAHRVIEIPGGTTRYEGCPKVSFAGGGNDPACVTITYHSSPQTKTEGPRRGEIVFRDVLEYRWIDFNAAYEEHPKHEEDFAFSLIEILDSAYVETMAANSGHRDFPGERIRGMPESMVRHFRFGVDDWGTVDIIATEIEIRELPATGLDGCAHAD